MNYFKEWRRDLLPAWWQALGAIVLAVTVIVFVVAEFVFAGWLLSAGLLLLLISSFRVYRREREKRATLEAQSIAQPPETREEAARRLIRDRWERGRQLFLGPSMGLENQRQDWLKWQQETLVLVGEMFGPAVAREFEYARDMQRGDVKAWLSSQTEKLDYWVREQLPPLLGGWQP
jgi:hypothetical protein